VTFGALNTKKTQAQHNNNQIENRRKYNTKNVPKKPQDKLIDYQTIWKG